MARKFTVVSTSRLQGYLVGFAFRPGAREGTKPDTRHCHASILLPCSKRVKLHVMMAPVAARTASRWRTVASGTPISLAISKSSRCPYFFKHFRVSLTVHVLGKTIV